MSLFPKFKNQERDIEWAAIPANPAILNRQISEISGISNTPHADHRDHDHSVILDHLTETERQAYVGWYDVMTGEKFNMSEEEAHKEAMKLLLKTSRLLKIDQATQDYKLDGFIKIFSTKLNRSIYLVRDERTKAGVPDKSLQVFVESEIKGFRGLSRDEILLLIEARTILNFNGVIVDGGQNEK